MLRQNEVLLGSPVLSTRVYGISGGLAKDRCLSLRSQELIGHLIPGSRVLDIGTGAGMRTMELWEMRPSSLVTTDFQPQTIERAQANWRKHGKTPDDIKWMLHDANTSLPFDIGKFRVVRDESVAHHLDRKRIKAAIANRVSHLEVGGVMSFAVLATSFAKEFYIPAGTEDGTPMYFPLIRGMKLGTQLKDIPPEMLVEMHREYYPDPEFYDDCFAINGVSFRKAHAVIGEHFKKTIYAPLSEDTVVWDFWIITKEAETF